MPRARLTLALPLSLLVSLACVAGPSRDDAGDAVRILEHPTAAEVAPLASEHLGLAVDAGELHLVNVADLEGVIAVGERVTTHSATLRGVLVAVEGGWRFGGAEDLCSEAMAHNGWEHAAAEDRASLALAWVKGVVLEFAGGVVYEDPGVFGREGRPAFSPPVATPAEGGGVQVRLWLREVERGRSSTKQFSPQAWDLDADGSCARVPWEAGFSVPNQELFRRR